MHPFTLNDFVRESNEIEGINRIDDDDVRAHEYILSEPLSVRSLELFVSLIQPGAKLRDKIGMDVRVGNHFPPQGGKIIRKNLETLIEIRSTLIPWELHCKYEDLHPFMDGNGRSGRALWLKAMGGIEKAPLGFLHHFYYQTLQEGRK